MKRHALPTSLRLGWLALLTTLLATPVARGELPHAREDWMVGLSFGVGPGQLTDAVRDETSTETGLVGQLRVGTMVSRRFLAHLEVQIWSHEDWVGYEKIDFSLWQFAAATTFYPGDPTRWTGGTWVRAGLGFTNAKADRLDSAALGITVAGWGWLLGAGYEWRFSQRFAMGLGLSVDQLVLDNDAVKDGRFAPVTVDFNWYF